MAVTLQSDRVQISNRWVHCDGTNAGFLRSDGNWDVYFNNGGNIYSTNYGWLHDFFFYNTSNCINGLATVATGPVGTNSAVNCYGAGNIVSNRSLEIVDNGGNIYLRNIQTLTNCNCACDCG